MSRNTAQPRRVSTAAATTGFVIGLMLALTLTATAADFYRVGFGDTLAAIAQKHGLKGADGWRAIYDANPEVADPDLIVPGQRLRIPDAGERVKPRSLPEVVILDAPRRPHRASRAAADPAPAAAPVTRVWTQLAACESGGNWAANTGNGYYGGLQFSLSTWRGLGGNGYPHQASAATQIAMGQRLQASQGWGAWPGCAGELGLG